MTTPSNQADSFAEAGRRVGEHVAMLRETGQDDLAKRVVDLFDEAVETALDTPVRPAGSHVHQGVMTERPIYLAGGINGLSDADAKDWRTEASALFGGNALDPMARDYRGKEDENVAAIVEGDKADIRQCRAVLAYCPRPSWGTAMEIYFAWSIGIPVIAVVPDGPVSPWLRAHTNAVVRSIAEFIQVMKA